MQRLAQSLDLPPEACRYVCLPGHGDGESFENVDAEGWAHSFRDQYRMAVAGSERNVFVGYSLGGLVMTHALGSGHIPLPERQVLLAPALAFPFWAKFRTLLPQSGMESVTIPSMAPAEYRVRSGITLGAYRALFQLREELEELPATAYDIPSLVLCDQHDELVDARGLEAFIAEKALSRWQLHILPSRPWERLGKKHLIIAPEFQSEEYQNNIHKHILQFLSTVSWD